MLLLVTYETLVYKSYAVQANVCNRGLRFIPIDTLLIATNPMMSYFSLVPRPIPAIQMKRRSLEPSAKAALRVTSR